MCQFLMLTLHKPWVTLQELTGFFGVTFLLFDLRLAKATMQWV